MYQVSKTSWHRWVKEKKLTEHRTPGGHRRYDTAELERVFSLSAGMVSTENDVATYARVSTQKPAENLTRQHERLGEACSDKGYRIVLDCSEVASGLNDHRCQFFKIIDAACRGEVKKVVGEPRDRLTRVGFRILERFFNGVGCTVEILRKLKANGTRKNWSRTS